MTTPYHPRNGPHEMHDLIDKHVPQSEARLQEHYNKAAETRALLKKLGCWPVIYTNPKPPGRKKGAGKTVSELGREAYEWAVANNATTMEAADHCKVSPDAIHSYRQYRKLPKLRK